MCKECGSGCRDVDAIVVISMVKPHGHEGDDVPSQMEKCNSSKTDTRKIKDAVDSLDALYSVYQLTLCYWITTPEAELVIPPHPLLLFARPERPSFDLVAESAEKLNFTCIAKNEAQNARWKSVIRNQCLLIFRRPLLLIYNSNRRRTSP